MFLVHTSSILRSLLVEAGPENVRPNEYLNVPQFLLYRQRANKTIVSFDRKCTQNEVVVHSCRSLPIPICNMLYDVGS